VAIKATPTDSCNPVHESLLGPLTGGHKGHPYGWIVLAFYGVVITWNIRRTSGDGEVRGGASILWGGYYIDYSTGDVDDFDDVLVGCEALNLCGC